MNVNLFPPKAALFDMDGVCYDSMPNHAIAWQRSMRTFGITMTEEDAYLTEGQRGTDTIKQLVKAQRGIDISDEEAQRMYDEKAREFGLLPTTKIMPGVLDFMALLKSRDIKIGIVTGSGQRPLIERLQREFAEYVQPGHIVTAYDVTQGKPHPEPYLKGAQLLGVSPRHTVVIENAPLGVQAGVAAGCYTIAVNTGPLPNHDLRKAGARHVFKTFRRLSAAWPTLFPPVADDEGRWLYICNQIVTFIKTRKRRPSKHHPEDRQMHNWIKHNKRLLARGEMPPERVRHFQELLDLAAKYRRVNQYVYAPDNDESQLELPFPA